MTPPLHGNAGRKRGARARLGAAIGVVAVGTVFAGAASPPSGGARKPPTKVVVTMVDYRFRLSASAVPTGKVLFEVVNRGAVAHDLVFSKGDRTRVLQPGSKQTIVVSFARGGVYRFHCGVAGHAALGMRGTLRVGTSRRPAPKPVVAAPAPKPAPRPPNSRAVRLTAIARGLGAITDVAAPPGEKTRLMVVRQDGLVLLLEDGVVRQTPFLDLRAFTRENGEKGLLSIAFSPDYAADGLLYAFYTDLNGDVRIAELRRSAGDPDVAEPSRELLRVVQPTAVHNGGMMQFGPDGHLYVAVGDGGAAPPDLPVGAFGQTLDDLLGTILRIDPRGGIPYAIPPGNPFAGRLDARPEIVAYGLRNPWRFWIDARTNAMLIGDVGEGEREEIDRLRLDDLGRNFGWPCKEGTITPSGVPIPHSCSAATLTPPIYEYSHANGRCSITGGVVVRDSRLPALEGLYLWSDLCDGRLIAVDPAATRLVEEPLGVSVKQPTTFGEDGLGRVYVATYGGGLYRLDPAVTPPAPRTG